MTEEGYCWLNHSVFLFPLAMLLYALAVKVNWLKDHEVAERRFLVCMVIFSMYGNF